MIEIAPNCPPWLTGLAGFGLGAMSKQSLQRLRALAQGRPVDGGPSSEG